MTHQASFINSLIPWQSEKVYFDADNYYQELLFEIENAKKTIEIECYIFELDTLGNKFINTLIQAAERKLSIRISIDGYGSLSWNLDIIEKLNSSGIEVKVFHPLPWRISLYKGVKAATGWFEKLLYLTSRVNKRNHRKLFVIDNNSAWSGSLNISRSHLSQLSHGANWLDCGVNVSGTVVTYLVDNFNEVWQRKLTYHPDYFQLPFRSNNNPILRRQKNNELIKLITKCQSRIWIINAYLAPSKRILRALKQARKRGVDVKLLISRRTDVIFFPLVSTTYYQQLLAVDIKIYEYNEQIIHAKTMLLDNLLLVGSSNLNHRSFLHDLELDFIMTKQTSINTTEAKFRQLVDKSEVVTVKRFESIVWSKKVLGQLLWKLRYWL